MGSFRFVYCRERPPWLKLTWHKVLISDFLDASVSTNRIESYLNGPEIKPITEDGSDIAFEGVSIAWPVDEETPDEERFVLRAINLRFPRGELSVISGKTGSGKSLLLSALIGEADLVKGRIFAPNAPTIFERHDHKANRDNWIIPTLKAYVAQTPWIENASLRDNILFGLPLDEERFGQTLDACALRQDLAMFPDGDLTELGTNGINLSGGQKWRVTLARAVYSRAGILVLDDIFSAVDVHVGRHIFEKCLTGELCRGRTRILVTHHVALCQPRTRFLVELGEGTVLHAGFIEELREDGTLELIKAHEESEQGLGGETAVTPHGEEPQDGNGGFPNDALSKLPRRFIEEEGREKGAVKTTVYKAYFRSSGGYSAWAAAVFMWIVFEGCIVGMKPGFPSVTLANTTSSPLVLAQDMDRIGGGRPRARRRNGYPSPPAPTRRASRTPTLPLLLPRNIHRHIRHNSPHRRNLLPLQLPSLHQS